MSSRSTLWVFVLGAGSLLAGVTACAEREPPPPPDTAVPNMKPADSLSTAPDTLRGDSLMARDTLWIPE
ncbi:MAG: hypothetical protein OEY20_06125 [Gemmatimonadota bacterium]|nr:hypothetical protein [Gemmatimonadota bacterium]